MRKKVITGEWGDAKIWRWETPEEELIREENVSPEIAAMYILLDQASLNALDAVNKKV